MRKRRIWVSILIVAQCFWLYSCGDEGIRTTLHDLGAAPAAVGFIAPVPKEIQDIIWGKDVPTLMTELQAYLEKGFDSFAQGTIHKICLRREQEAYYSKYIDAGGVAIMGHKIIEDRLFYAARDLALGMTQKRPELRTMLTPTHAERPGTKRDGIHAETGLPVPSRKFRYILVDPYQGQNLIPERRYSGGTVNYPASGSPGSCFPLYCRQTVAIRDMNWGKDGEPKLEAHIAKVFCHEFAHAIHYAIRLIDSTFEDRLKAAYDEAIANARSVNNLDGKGYWPSGSYALSNPGEYWAECVSVWFNDLSAPGLSHFLDRFREGDPLMYALLNEWFDFIYLREVEWKEY